MSFRKWLRLWIRSFRRLWRVNDGPYKSEEQRKKEKEQRREAKYETKAPHEKHFKEKRSRRKETTKNARLAEALLDFFFTTLALLLVPVGLLKLGYKRAIKPSKKKIKGVKPIQKGKDTALNIIERDEAFRGSNKQPSVPQAVKNGERAEVKALEDVDAVREIASPECEHQSNRDFKAQDPDAPKSTPRKAEDEYIRRRMTVSVEACCDGNLGILTVGENFNMALDHSGPYGKDSVAALIEDRVVGYVSREVSAPLAVYLTLGRRIYGVITDVRGEGDEATYEFEAWFAS